MSVPKKKHVNFFGFVSIRMAKHLLDSPQIVASQPPPTVVRLGQTVMSFKESKIVQIWTMLELHYYGCMFLS